MQKKHALVMEADCPRYYDFCWSERQNLFKEIDWTYLSCKCRVYIFLHSSELMGCKHDNSQRLVFIEERKAYCWQMLMITYLRKTGRVNRHGSWLNLRALACKWQIPESELWYIWEMIVITRRAKWNAYSQHETLSAIKAVRFRFKIG